jgi:hypothetical protein
MKEEKRMTGRNREREREEKEDLGKRGNLILKRILQEQNMRVGTGQNWQALVKTVMDLRVS